MAKTNTKSLLKMKSALTVTAHVNVSEAALVTLGKDELKAMKDEDHGAEITCQFCGKTYNFTEDDLEGLD